MRADAHEALGAIESLVEQLSRVADPETLAGAQSLVRAVLELHAAGLARVLDLARGGAVSGGSAPLLDAVLADDLIASLLILHDLHPLSLEARARAALARANPPGWSSELLGVEAGVLRVAVKRVGDPARSATSERARTLVVQAIERAAPDAEGLEVVGDVDEAPPPAKLLPVERLVRGPAADAGGHR